MNDKDIRWIQRFANYRKALSRLSQAVDILSGQENGELDDLLTGKEPAAFPCPYLSIRTAYKGYG